MEDSIGENAADTVPRKTRFRLTRAVIPGSLPSTEPAALQKFPCSCDAFAIQTLIGLSVSVIGSYGAWRGAAHRDPHVGRGIRRAAGAVGVALAVSVLGFASLLAAWFPAALPARPHSCASGVGLIRSGPDSYDFFQPLA